MAEHVDPAALTAVLDGDRGELRRSLRERLTSTKLADSYDLDREAHPAQVLAQMHELVATGHPRLGVGRAGGGAVVEQMHELLATGPPRLGFAREYGGEGDIGGSVVSFQLLGYGDLSLMVKAGVQWGLFGGAVQMLGTRRHHERYLRDIMSMALPGCFAMTESGHGSDVQHLRTTATFADGGFVLDTPDDDARKGYIRNAAPGGRAAVGVRAAGHRRAKPGRARVRRADPRRRRAGSAGRADRGLRAEGGPERRRQRAAVVVRGARGARGAAQP